MSARTVQMLLVILASLSTVAATDIFLPSLPSMAAYFNASENATQLTIPLYLVGSLLAAPLLGILSDHYGRRPVMLFGLALFLCGTAICMYSPSLSFLLRGRFIQGLGAIVSPVVGWALLQDLYPKDEGARVMAWAGSITCIAPLIAPGLGGYIHKAFGWQGNFLILFLFGAMTFLLMLFSKSTPKVFVKKGKLSPFDSLNTYKKIITHKPFLIYMSFFALLTCGEWCYLTFIPFYFEDSLHLSPDIFGLYLSGSASFYVLAALVSPLIVQWLGVNKTLEGGIALSLIGSLLLLCVAVLAPTFPLLIVITVGIYFFGMAGIWGPSISRALQCFEDIRGSASAVRSLCIIGCSIAGSFVGTFLDDTSLLPLSLFLLITTVGCVISFQSLMKLEKESV